MWKSARLKSNGDKSLRSSAGFDEPLESWAQDTVHRVVREPLLAVVQAAAEIGQQAVELAQAAMDGNDVTGQQRLIRPHLIWQRND